MAWTGVAGTGAGRVVACSLLALGVILPQKILADDKKDVEFYQLPTGEVVATGARRPSAEEKAAAEKHMIKTLGVRLSALGLERVNKALKEKGEKELSNEEAGVVPTGSEATASGAEAPMALPGSVDNSVLKYFPPVRSQGSLGSCSQFSSMYYTMTHMTAMVRDWDAKNGGDSYRFSPKWTYNVLNGGENVGTWQYDGYAIAQKHGVATWAEFPYDGDYRAWCLNAAVWRNAINVRADQTGRIPDVDTDAGLANVKQLLVNGYILNYSTYIYSWQSSAIKNDPSTTNDDAYVGQSIVASVNGTSGGHTMTIVGYNDDLWLDVDNDGFVDAGEKGALRIVNSWGTGWGMGGFGWISYNALRVRNAARTSEGVFWYDEAQWVTARSTYTPRLVAQFTMNHLKRNQLQVLLGVSATSSSTPTTYWYPNKILQNAGGAWAFNGGSTAVDGSFCLDFTDIVPTTSGMKRYFLRMSDSTSGDASILKAFKLMDVAKGSEIVYGAVPKTADAGYADSFLDYDVGGNAAPVAVVNATPTSGNLPLVVSFDGTGSYDPDGSIASYSWNFGDGSTAVGVTAAHTYSSGGNYTATLTVTDNAGAPSSSSVVISVIDPNVLNAPSGLSAKASSRTVTLTWTDNSNNETGFYIERGVKVKAGTTYTRVATVAADVKTYSETVSSGTYYYRVQAFNSVTGRTSAYSNVVSIRVR